MRSDGREVLATIAYEADAWFDVDEREYAALAESIPALETLVEEDAAS